MGLHQGFILDSLGRGSLQHPQILSWIRHFYTYSFCDASEWLTTKYLLFQPLWHLPYKQILPQPEFLKLVLAIFYFYTKWQPCENYEKCFLFHPKRSFHSWDIQIFVFMSSPLFLPVGRYFRGWSKINPKINDVINCIKKNLIRHFVWYLEKEKRYGIETLPIVRVWNRKHFYGKIMHKMWTKNRPLFNFSK